MDTASNGTHPKRKHPRLKEYDYSLPGYYYVTVQTASPDLRLSVIEREAGTDRALVRLTRLGKHARTLLFELEKRYDYIKIDKYVIMPTHIHMIVRFIGGPDATEPRPDLPAVIGTFKSLTTRKANEAFDTPGRKLFQTSFYDMVLRSEKGYQDCWRYIDGDPSKWLEAEEGSVIQHDTI